MSKIVALELEKQKPKDQQVARKSNNMTQKRIDTMQNECARDAYHKLMRTAYELSLHPTLSTKRFKTFVNVLRINGVRLV